MHHRPSNPPAPQSTGQVLRRLAAVALTAGVLVGSASGIASAKEVGSGGGGGGGGGGTSTTCNPVTRLGYKGDATTSDTAVGSIAIDYGVKPCTNGQAVTVDVKLYESANPAAVAYDNPGSPLSGKPTVFGVKVNTSYIAKVTVYDTVTGTVAGSSQIFAAAVRKTGV